MKSSAKKIELASVDDLFSTEESRQDEQLEKIQEIPLSELHPFKDHPFKVKDDDAMIETADSIKKYGVLVPAIARPLPDGGYELVAGHRRRRASELAGKETMPVIVRDLDDDAATIIMVDSNLQRENLLPSERAFAYKMKLEAIKHQGARTDLTSVQVEQKLSARHHAYGHHRIGSSQFPVRADVGSCIQEFGCDLVQHLSFVRDTFRQDYVECRDTVCCNHHQYIVVDVVHIAYFTMIDTLLSWEIEVCFC